jgi:endo-1,4-beta-D-glucanase Y
MNLNNLLCLLGISVLSLACNKQDDIIIPDAVPPNHPYPSHSTYLGSHIKPNNFTQQQIDKQVQLFYDEWKSEYLKNDCDNSSEYYIYSGDGANNVSEAQGYGMMIVAYMAGYEQSAQFYFNGLYRYFKSYPSNINNNLMDWQQVHCDDSPSDDDNSASDGDIDIAFSLLLAHKQWGSLGEIDYLAEAQTVINAIMQNDINHDNSTVMLGDWCEAEEPNYYHGTRPSDFITDHFKAFSEATNNSDWNNIIDKCYDLIDEIQTNYSSSTGLLPDFIINTNTTPSPAGAEYLEDIYDGKYYYNACRVPWRLGTDYLVNGDIRAKSAITKINTWLLISTNGHVNNISNGYELNGTAIYNWNDATFVGPFTVGAMLDSNNQNWLNDLYTELIENNELDDGDYYSNTIKLLSMIVISGNYWSPN